MDSNTADNFRPVFKYYKSRKPRPDLSAVVTVGPGKEGVVPLSLASQPPTVCPRCCHCAGLRDPRHWRVFALTSNPGLLVIRNPFTTAGQRMWIAKCLAEYPDPPNINNITNALHKSLPKRITDTEIPSIDLSRDTNVNNAACGDVGLDRGAPCQNLLGSGAVEGAMASTNTSASECSKSKLANLPPQDADHQTQQLESKSIFPSLLDDSRRAVESSVGSWWQDVLESGGVKTETCQKLRWATLGYHHDWDTKVMRQAVHPLCFIQQQLKGQHYSPEKHTPIPPCMANLTATLARGLAMFLPSDLQEGQAHTIGDQTGRSSDTDSVIRHSSYQTEKDMSPTAVSVPKGDSSQKKGFPNTSTANTVAPSASCTTDTILTPAHLAISRAQLLQFRAEAAIVNYYHPGTTLSPHNDISEPNREAPLFSISFGQPCVFLVGGPSKDVTPTPIALHSGDVVVMGGTARLAYHAVPLVTTLDQWRAMAGVLGAEQEPWKEEQDTDIGKEGCCWDLKQMENRENDNEDNFFRNGNQKRKPDEKTSESKLFGCDHELTKVENYVNTDAISVESSKEDCCEGNKVDEADPVSFLKSKRSMKYVSEPSKCPDVGCYKRSKLEPISDERSSLLLENHFCKDQVFSYVAGTPLFNEYKIFSEYERIAFLEYICYNRINMNIRQVCAPGELCLRVNN